MGNTMGIVERLRGGKSLLTHLSKQSISLRIWFAIELIEGRHGFICRFNYSAKAASIKGVKTQSS